MFDADYVCANWDRPGICAEKLVKKVRQRSCEKFLELN